MIVDDKIINALNVAKKHDRSLWGVSSTLYVQIVSDVVLEPLKCFIGHQYAVITLLYVQQTMFSNRLLPTSMMMNK